jgi:hypothetical protein
MASRRWAVIGLLAGLGCGRPGLKGSAGQPADGAVPEAAAASPDALDAAPLADAAADLAAADLAAAPDLSAPDARPSALEEYRRFAAARAELEKKRYVECFGASARLVARWRLDADAAQFTASLLGGLTALDPARAEACLEAMRTVSCEQFAANEAGRACENVLAGKVGPMGSCASRGDCQMPDVYYCGRSDADACASRCLPRVAAGQDCLFRQCVPGTHCGRDAQDQDRCLPDLEQGVRCHFGESCKPGDYCRWDGPRTFDGVCRPLAPGGPCTGQWNCAWPYTCLMDGPERGHCGVGRGPGHPCQLYGHDAYNGPYSQCAATLTCYPDAAGTWRCGDGREAGEACGFLPPPMPGPDQNGSAIPCADGFCNPEENGTCQPWRALGQACVGDFQCQSGLVCPHGKCVERSVLDLPEGAACTLGGKEICVPGTFCAVDDRRPAGHLPTGTCRSLDSQGQACTRQQQCGPLAGCVAGRCMSCRP